MILPQVLDGQLGELGGSILDEIAENGLLVVADQVDFVYRGDLVNGGQAVPDDWVASNVEEGLR